MQLVAVHEAALCELRAQASVCVSFVHSMAEHMRTHATSTAARLTAEVHLRYLWVFWFGEVGRWVGRGRVGRVGRV